MPSTEEALEGIDGRGKIALLRKVFGRCEGPEEHLLALKILASLDWLGRLNLLERQAALETLRFWEPKVIPWLLAHCPQGRARSLCGDHIIKAICFDFIEPLRAVLARSSRVPPAASAAPLTLPDPGDLKFALAYAAPISRVRFFAALSLLAAGNAAYESYFSGATLELSELLTEQQAALVRLEIRRMNNPAECERRLRYY